MSNHHHMIRACIKMQRLHIAWHVIMQTLQPKKIVFQSMKNDKN